MIRNFLRTSPLALVLLTATSALADEQSDKCMSMLGTAVGMELETEGFDIANACNLTVAQLAQIKDLLETQGMGSRSRIEKILSEAK